MPLIELSAVSKDWGLDPIFKDLSLKIEEGEKIGLVGRNGSGKTSLMRIIAGLDLDYRGKVSRKPALRLALVPQRYEPPEGLSCVEVLLRGARAARARMDELAEMLAAPGAAPDGALGDGIGQRGGSAVGPGDLLRSYGEACARFEELGGEAAEELSRRVLERAGLGQAADCPASALSGGEKNVLALAAALAEAPELLLLDEPGNHLDFPGLEWLESFVRGERRAVLMVSHNRSLLDASADRILELEGGRLCAYRGGYSAYRVEKLSRAAGQGKEWQADRKRLERLEALVERFARIAAARPDPAWGKRLRARRSQLEREREAAAARPGRGAPRMSVSFAAAEAKADYALVVSGYRKAYGDRILFEDASFDLHAGERAAIVGPNGSGKTSFIRDLAARASLPPDARWESGQSIRVGPSMRLGYCSQEQEALEAGLTVGESFAELGAVADEAWRLLRLYCFPRSILETDMALLSGGERNRLQIARAVFLGADFLVLDEPTNHLDIESREALEEGLEDFAGTLLVVSHDRWFLEKAVERVLLVEDRGFTAYEGSFAEFWRDAGRPRAARSRASARGAGLEDRGAAVGDSKAIRGASSTALGFSQAAARRLSLEERITSLEREKESLERASAAASASRDFQRSGAAADKARVLSRQLERLYAEWEALA